ncbi:MAG: cytochrome b N-terminal domain-containing protein [Actinomycetota bacterium]|nr:cytochrome b N-terminal domain-containing protein [Actinomycetota bacterium]
MIRRPVRALDERLGLAAPLRALLRYVFPDHWSFMLGEVALYAFVVLVATGVFLTLHYEPSDVTTTYTGTYLPLQGREMGAQFASVLRIVFDVPAGNLIRQMHHWAANVFVAAIVLHLVRVILTGAFRKPRELNYWIGVTMLMLAVLEGFAGYSLIDDLLSGMGLVIAYAVGLSLPVIGASVTFLLFGAEFPGVESFWPRLEIVHVLVLPAILAALMSVHLASIARQHHTQFPGPRRTEVQVHGTPLWPGYALRSIGLLFVVVGLLALLGGLVQINPIWEWGPYEPHLASNGAQPDWYLGWLIGGLRMMPPLEVHFGGYTLVPNPFFGGALFPMIVFGVLYAWPLIDRRRFGDRRRHHLLQRPRDNPRRAAAFVAFSTWVLLVFFAGSADRVFFRTDIDYEIQLWALRIATVLLPFVAYLVTHRLCRELAGREDHPLRGWTGSVVRRNAAGGWSADAGDRGDRPAGTSGPAA